MRWPTCTKHDGRHLNVYGQCVHPGAPVAIRIRPCPDCERDVAFSRNLASGRVTVLEEGSDARHLHPLPVRVEIDEEGLAAGIAGALDSLMQRRREQRATVKVSAAPEPASDERGPPTDFPDVEVWTDDGAPV